jgi:hypothetical protein
LPAPKGLLHLRFEDLLHHLVDSRAPVVAFLHRFQQRRFPFFAGRVDFQASTCIRKPSKFLCISPTPMDNAACKEKGSECFGQHRLKIARKSHVLGHQHAVAGRQRQPGSNARPLAQRRVVFLALAWVMP